MAAMTYFVALGFKRSEDGGEIVAWIQKRHEVQSKRSEWPPPWLQRRDIAEPSRSRGLAIRLLVTSKMP